MITIDKILVPVDFSECARAALKYAVHFGEKLQATTIDVLHVWKPPAFLNLDVKLPDKNGKEQTLAEFAKSGAGDAMKEFLAEIEAGGDFTVRGRLESGIPNQTIVQVAEAEGYNLIIMGTHGESRAEKLGSIAQKVVRNASCPVLTIRSKECCCD